jgi:glycosyltransferase involved in cell wall biosynthesis
MKNDKAFRMAEPLVSVKMITYNHGPYIAQAIEGVLQQRTNFVFELVIGEDCSTDGTREIVLDYQKKYPDIIRVIATDQNVGMKKNSLRTLKACRGKYLAFCEGDDYWHHPLKLQKQADHLESHPECGLVYSSHDRYFVHSHKTIKDYIKHRKREIPENTTISDILQGKGVPLTCTVMVRRDLCEAVIEADPYLHQSDEFMMGDTQLWAEMATKARLYYIPESLATYNVVEESATRSKDKSKMSRFAVSSARLRLYLCDKYKLAAFIKCKQQEYLFDSLLRFAFHTRNGELADEVRYKKKNFTIKEWLRYLGAKHIAYHRMYRVLASLRSLVSNK